MQRINEVLEFWFEGVTDETEIKKKDLPFKKWFSGGRRFDDEVRGQFEGDLLKAFQGEYKNWEADIRGCLALILLFDQCSRNMYRGTPRMYAYDARALDLTCRLIQEKQDSKLFLIERSFLYMPLMHAEDLKMQTLSVQCFEGLVAESKLKFPQNTAYYENNLSYARGHYEDIETHGRFPYRDSILKRSSYGCDVL